MGLIESNVKKERIYRHGGREVLRVSAANVKGECAAAQHTAALVETLAAYAERVLLPRAVEVLDLAVKNGKGYAFFTYRYGIDVRETRMARGTRITLYATLDTGASCEERTLCMYWTRDGAWQIKKHHPVG